MRTAAIGIALLALTVVPALPTGPVAHASSFTCNGFGDDVHWSDRLDPGDARIAITTEDDGMTLLLTDEVVAFQLSNRALRKAHRELREAEHESDNWFASVIVTTVAATVRNLLDHSFVCDVRDLRDVSYEDGHLVFIGRDGSLVFGDGEACDSDVTSAFSERDAKRFVREFRRVKASH